MYSNSTSHYGIPIVEANDEFNPMDWNASSKKIDEALYQASTGGSSPDIEGIKADISNLQSGLAETDNSVADLSVKVSDVEGDVGTVSSSVSEVSGKVETVENELTVVSSSVNTVANMITTKYIIDTSASDVAINTGEWFRTSEGLFICTIDIAIGDAIVVGSNCKSSNVETEGNTLLSSVNSVIASLTARIEELEGRSVNVWDWKNAESFTNNQTYTATKDGVLFITYATSSNVSTRPLLYINGMGKYSASVNTVNPQLIHIDVPIASGDTYNFTGTNLTSIVLYFVPFK